MTWLGNGLRARSLCPVRRWRAVSDGSAARGAKEAGVFCLPPPASTAAGRRCEIIRGGFRMEDETNIGQRIYDLRVERDIAQGTLADAVHLH